MATVRTDFRLPAPLLERVDEARGQETRTRFLVRALEAFLDVPRVAVQELEQKVPGRLDTSTFDPSLRSPVASSAAKAGVVPR